MAAARSRPVPALSASTTGRVSDPAQHATVEEGLRQPGQVARAAAAARSASHVERSEIVAQSSPESGSLHSTA